MSLKTSRRIVLLVAFAAAYVAFIINAQSIKHRFAADFSFGEPEMVKLLDSLGRDRTWLFRVAGEDYKVRLVLNRAADPAMHRHAMWHALSSTALACESRSFGQSASACYDTTSLPLQGTATLSRRTQAGWETLLEERTTGALLVATGRTLGRTQAEIVTDTMHFRFYSNDANAFVMTSARAKSRAPSGGDLQYSRAR